MDCLAIIAEPDYMSPHEDEDRDPSDDTGSEGDGEDTPKASNVVDIEDIAGAMGAMQRMGLTRDSQHSASLEDVQVHAYVDSIVVAGNRNSLLRIIVSYVMMALSNVIQHVELNTRSAHQACTNAVNKCRTHTLKVLLHRWVQERIQAFSLMIDARLAYRANETITKVCDWTHRPLSLIHI